MVTGSHGRAVLPQSRQRGRRDLLERRLAINRPQRLAYSRPQFSRQPVYRCDQPGGAGCRHAMAVSTSPSFAENLGRQHVLRAGSGDLADDNRLDSFPNGDLAREGRIEPSCVRPLHADKHFAAPDRDTRVRP